MILILITIIAIYYLISFGAIFYNLDLKRSGMKGIPFEECFNPIKWLSFTLGHLISLIPMHVIDQYIMRYADEECRQCVLNGECPHKKCGCRIEAVVASPLEQCKLGNFGPIIFSKKKFEQKYKLINYKFKVEYGKRNSDIEQSI